ncbi:hypothetical protein ACQR1Y_19910 [Bradyrhizobium sp. HKCCYLRH3099]|uniref:hypothetical protein n=1 Tax=unclassified Bradyrhizobium TaxID=2631580 RepID=UPI003EB85FA2
MSQTAKVVVLSSLAASVMLVGAMQLASGHDLASLATDAAARVSASDRGVVATSSHVNRSAKSDRAATAADAAPTQTVSIKLAAFADTTFLMRLPVAPPAASVAPSVPQGSQLITTDGRQQATKHPVACEPSVSVLTEIAKRLQPGRCLT